MLAKVRETVDEFNMLNMGDGVVVAVSGGPDSMALLHILRMMQTEYKLNLFAAHVNHMFRGSESDADAEHVAKVCRTWGIPFFCAKINVPAIMAERGLSAQVAAREVRYHFLKHVAAITGSKKIAVGHNADDQAETILMRFLRGAGAEGLSGMPAVRSGVVRPLIRVFRTEIEEYCREWRVESREDSSNKKTIYLRNRLRNQLIPQLEETYNCQLRRNLLALGEIMQGEEAYWTDITEREFANTVKWDTGTPYLDIEKFKRLFIAVQRRVLRSFFQKAGVTDAGFIHVEEVRNILTRGSVGDCIELPGKWQVIRDYTYASLEKENPTREIPQGFRSVQLEVPGSVLLPDGKTEVETSFNPVKYTQTINVHTGLFDWERLHKPLCVRTRQPGDQFFHVGAGHKKLKKYFIDLKIPRAKRDQVLLVIHGNDILWIVGYYADERYTANANTKTALHIVFREE